MITMGRGEACPIYPSKRYEDWTFDDPCRETVGEVRPIRDQIEDRIRRLLDETRLPARQ